MASPPNPDSNGPRTVGSGWFRGSLLALDLALPSDMQTTTNMCRLPWSYGSCSCDGLNIQVPPGADKYSRYSSIAHTLGLTGLTVTRQP
jgi:hypothetical protein